MIWDLRVYRNIATQWNGLIWHWVRLISAFALQLPLWKGTNNSICEERVRCNSVSAILYWAKNETIQIERSCVLKLIRTESCIYRKVFSVQNATQASWYSMRPMTVTLHSSNLNPANFFLFDCLILYFATTLKIFSNYWCSQYVCMYVHVFPFHKFLLIFMLLLFAPFPLPLRLPELLSAIETVKF